MHESENRAASEKGWEAEKIIVYIIALFIFISLFFLFGFAPLSKKRFGSITGELQADIPTYTRLNKEVVLNIRIQNKGKSEFKEVSISKNFLKKMETSSVNPKPKETLIGSEYYTFIFIQKSSKTDVSFKLRPKITGQHLLEIRSGENRLCPIDIYVYP
jgi:hypothetical protein